MSLSRIFAAPPTAIAAIAAMALVAGPMLTPATAQTRPSAPATAPANAPLSGDLLLVQRHLEGMRSMTADFSQTDRAGNVQRGRLTLLQPGRIRFQYEPGNPLLIVADGRSLNMIDYEVRQVQRWPIRNSPLAVLIDPAANLVRYGRLIPGTSNDVISVEVRDSARPEYGMITMIFERDAASPAGLKLYGWVALDAQRQRTTIRLTNVQYGVMVAESAFRWRDPRPTTPRR